MVRSLNDGWLFSKDSAKWEAVALPHTWNTDAYHTKSYYQGPCYYKRQFTIAPNLLNKHFFLRFNAAFKTATVWLNGHVVGRHAGGYTAFVVDLTPYLHAGANVLAIRVDNADSHVAPISADFTFMGGIYRDVELITTGAQHFEMSSDGASGVFIRQHDVTAEKASVSVRARLRNDDGQQQHCMISNEIFTPDGQPLSVTRKRVKIGGRQTVSVSSDIPSISRPQLWSPESPRLYLVRTTLLSTDGRVLDRQNHYLGLRWVRVDAEKGFFLNGKPYKLNGLCRHQDQRPYGVALDGDMQRRDFRMMKEMGCNFVRLAHYPQSEAFLEQCDREGMLVWEEVPVVNFVLDDSLFANNAELQLREMIRQHYNHPSIIFWGYMNEILLRTKHPSDGSQQPITRTVELAQRLERTLHVEDPSRLSAMAMHGSDDYNKYGLTDIPQVLGWNLYQGWYGGKLSGFEQYLANQHRQHPTHPVIVSEWGAGSDLRLHNADGKQFDFSCEYQQQFVEHYLPIISRTPYILGGSYWNFVDFSSANRAESMPFINNKGILTADRKPKDVFYYFQSAWRSDLPVIHIATRDWPDRTSVSTTQPIKVYSNATEVTLCLDDQPIGTSKVDNCHAMFNVTLHEGVNHLKATAVVGGKTCEDNADITFHPVPLNGSQLSEIAVNVGSACTFQSDKTGVTWVPDQPYVPGSWGFVGGESKSSQAMIACTDDGPLYQTQREGIEAYCFDVPAGCYELELLFADIHQRQQQSAYLLGRDSQNNAQGQSSATLFNIAVNGQLIDKDFSPAEEDGYFTAVRRRYLVETKTGQLKVTFSTNGAPAFLSGIKLRRK